MASNEESVVVVAVANAIDVVVAVAFNVVTATTVAGVVVDVVDDADVVVIVAVATPSHVDAVGVVVPFGVDVAHPDRNFPNVGPLPPSTRIGDPHPLRYPKSCNMCCSSFQSWCRP